jgi:hypothetical protein
MQYNTVSRKDWHFSSLEQIFNEKDFVWICHYNNNCSVSTLRKVRAQMFERGFGFMLVSKDVMRRSLWASFPGSTAVVYISISGRAFVDFPTNDYMFPLFVFSRGSSISLSHFSLFGNLSSRHFIFDVLCLVLQICIVSQVNALLISTLNYGNVESNK